MEKQQKDNNQEERKRNIKITFRIFQAFFFGLFALGISMISGDLVEVTTIPISNFSIATTIFGIVGALITGKLSKDCENW